MGISLSVARPSEDRVMTKFDPVNIYFDGLTEKKRFFRALAMELHSLCVKPLLWDWFRNTVT